MKKVLGALVAVALSAAPASAATIPLQVLAAWSNVDGGANISYTPGAGVLDDNPLVSWGNPVTAAGKSSYQFLSSFPLQFGAAPIGTQFKLGTFQHNNRPIALTTGIDSAELELAFNFDPLDTDPDSVGATSIIFHTETPNVGSQCPGEAPPCPDVVTISDSINVVQAFTYQGAKYQLTVLGFAVENGGGLEFDDEFVTQENALNSADLYAVITPVPEPGTMLLVGAGLLAGAARLRRRR